MKETSDVGPLLRALAVSAVATSAFGCSLENPALVTPPDSGSPDVLEPGNAGGSESGGRGGSGGGVSETSGGGTTESGGRAGSGGAEGGAPPVPDASLGRSDAGADASSGSDADACPPHHALCGSGGSGCGANLDTDPHHCGRCGHDCLGGDCTHGVCGAVLVAPACSASGCSQKPTTVAAALIRPTAVTAQAGAVFWASGSTYGTDGHCTSDGAIYTCKDCEGIPRSLQQNMSCPAHITSDSEYVYWIETDATSYNCTLDRMRLDGSGFENFASTNIAMLNIAVDDKAVYWLLLSGEVFKKAKD